MESNREMLLDMGGKRETEKPADRHKSRGKILRMHARLWEQLDELVDRNASDLSTEIRIAIRERLERAGLWPPKAPQGTDADAD